MCWVLEVLKYPYDNLLKQYKAVFGVLICGYEGRKYCRKNYIVKNPQWVILRFFAMITTIYSSYNSPKRKYPLFCSCPFSFKKNIYMRLALVSYINFRITSFINVTYSSLSTIHMTQYLDKWLYWFSTVT